MNDEAPTAGHNLKALNETVQNAAKRIQALKKKREATNTEVLAIRKSVKAAGIPLKAFDHAMRAQEMDQDARNDHDTFVAICREALGIPVQGELFGKASDA